ncbi:hypothetical protein A0H81_03274 [Grifola frondosa]|uniref:Uncharacterized protein n=1 Tax=Grifola frondosa TaxID=5627 RepID=A0A1C7MHZ9_GRIFR|nr:hypothetical protein A0H81_03274 [Grifola frondosa]
MTSPLGHGTPALSAHHIYTWLRIGPEQLDPVSDNVLLGLVGCPHGVHVSVQVLPISSITLYPSSAEQNGVPVVRTQDYKLGCVLSLQGHENYDRSSRSDYRLLGLHDAALRDELMHSISNPSHALPTVFGIHLNVPSDQTLATPRLAFLIIILLSCLVEH